MQTKKQKLRLKKLHRKKFLQDSADVAIDKDRLLFDFDWSCSCTEIDAGIQCIRILCRHLPKRILDNSWRIFTDTKFKKQNFSDAFMPAVFDYVPRLQKVLVLL